MADQTFIANVVGGVGGILGVGAIFLSAWQGSKTSALSSALESLKLEQGQKTFWKEEAASEKAKVAELQKDVIDLRSMVMLEKIPPALGEVLDRQTTMMEHITKMQGQIVEAVTSVLKMVQSSTGSVDQPSRKDL